MKTITLKPFALCLAVLGVWRIVSAQNDLNLPDVSQAAEVKERIASTNITVKYHRPLVNGRKIWGGLVPYGKVWRAGAPLTILHCRRARWEQPKEIQKRRLDAAFHAVVK